MENAVCSVLLQSLSTTCGVCRRSCNLNPWRVGRCGGYKAGISGEIEPNLYGVVTNIETEPLSRLPVLSWSGRSHALAVAAKGCAARCVHCTNEKEAHHPFQLLTGDEARFSPYRLAEKAMELHVALASDFVEPVNIGTFLVDAFEAAQDLGVPTILGTAGLFTNDFLDRLLPFTSVVRLDIKGWTLPALKKQGFWFKGIQPEFVFETALSARKHGAHLELTICVIPDVNDFPIILHRMTRRIITVLGEDTPLTLSGHWKGNNKDPFQVPTKAHLERIRRVIIQNGLTQVRIAEIGKV